MTGNNLKKMPQIVLLFGEAGSVSAQKKISTIKHTAYPHQDSSKPGGGGGAGPLE